MEPVLYRYPEVPVGVTRWDVGENCWTLKLNDMMSNRVDTQLFQQDKRRAFAWRDCDAMANMMVRELCVVQLWRCRRTL